MKIKIQKEEMNNKNNKIRCLEYIQKDIVQLVK